MGALFHLCLDTSYEDGEEKNMDQKTYSVFEYKKWAKPGAVVIKTFVAPPRPPGPFFSFLCVYAIYWTN